MTAPELIRTDRIRPAAGLGAAAESEPGAREARESAPERASRAAGDAGLGLDVRVLWVARPLAPSGLVPFAAGADLALDLGGADVALDTPELTAGCLAATGAGARDARERLNVIESVVLLDARRAVPAREPTTWEVAFQANEFVEDPRDWLDEFPDRGPFPRTVALALTPASGTLGVTLAVTDLDPDAERALVEALAEEPGRLPSAPPAPYDEALRTEAVRTAIPLEPDGTLDLVLQLDPPFGAHRRAGAERPALVFVIRGQRIPGATEAILQATAERDAAVAAARAAAEPYTEAAAEDLVREEALRSFQQRGGRAALLALSLESGADLAADLALVARDEDLAALAALAFPPAAAGNDAENGAAPGQPIDPNSIQWRLESSAWRLLSERALEEELTPELRGVLFRSAGALAAYPDVLLEGLRASGGSVAVFQDRLMAEQRLALEESAAQARVRAHDWLSARGAAVPDYDPLAPREQRRAALTASAEASEEEAP